MRKIVVSEWITLDGVFDADTMKQWFIPYHSDSRAKHIREGILGCDAMVYGRTTYEMLAPYWSGRKNNEDGVADKLNSVSKYVVSSKLKKAEWHNSTIIDGNMKDGITKLKHQAGGNILITGSATLVRSLMGAGLIDELDFLVHPVIMGGGKRFFKEEMNAGLELVRTQTLDLGVVLLSYRPAKA